MNSSKLMVILFVIVFFVTYTLSNISSNNVNKLDKIVCINDKCYAVNELCNDMICKYNITGLVEINYEIEVPREKNFLNIIIAAIATIVIIIFIKQVNDKYKGLY